MATTASRIKSCKKNYKKLLTNKQGCGNIYSQGEAPDIDNADEMFCLWRRKYEEKHLLNSA